MVPRSAERHDRSPEDKLDIFIRQNRYVTEFRLSGRLYGSAVRRLEKLWIQHIDTSSILLLDIRGLNYIDPAGGKLLSFMQQEGVQILVGAGEGETYSTALTPAAWPDTRN